MGKKKYPDGGKLKSLPQRVEVGSDNTVRDKEAFMQQAKGKQQTQTTYSKGSSENLTNLVNNLGSYFLGMENTTLKPSNYRPTKAKDPNAKYSTWQFLKNDVKADLISPARLNWINTREGMLASKNKDYVPTPVDTATFDKLYNYHSKAKGAYQVKGNSANLGLYSVTAGKDKRGRYFAIHDKYDWNMFEQLGFPGNSWETYDRIYEDEWDKIPTKNKKSKMPDGGKINKMPDPKKIITNPTQAEQARAARILALSKEWNVPSASIFSQSRYGQESRPREGGYTSYYTFDPQGNIQYSTRDYNDPLGYSQYTPADIQLQQQYPGKGMTVAQQQMQQGVTTGVPITKVSTPSNMNWGGKMKSKIKNSTVNYYQNPKPIGNPNIDLTWDSNNFQVGTNPDGTPIWGNPMQNQPFDLLSQLQYGNAPIQNWGGKTKGKKKAQYGLEVDPYQNLQPIQGYYPQQPSTALQNPTPELQTLPTYNTPQTKVGGRGKKGVQFGNVNINLGAAITGLAGAANQAFAQANVAEQAAMNQRLTLQQETYNPYQFGNGSQALFEHGGKIPDHVFDLSKKDIKRLQAMGYTIEEIK